MILCIDMIIFGLIYLKVTLHTEVSTPKWGDSRKHGDQFGSY